MTKNNFFLCFFLIFFTVTTLSASEIAIDNPGNKDVQELITSWVAMWNSCDLAMVDQLFLLDSRVSYFSSEKEGLIQGIDAVRNHHVGFGFVDGGKSQENKLWVKDVQVSDFGRAPRPPQFFHIQIGLTTGRIFI